MGEPTPDQRKFVESLAARGDAEGLIAVMLGTSQEVIVRDYAVELRQGRARYRTARFHTAWRKLAHDMNLKWALEVAPPPAMGRDEEEVYLAKMRVRISEIGCEPVQEGKPDTRMARIISLFDDATLVVLELGDLEDLIGAAVDAATDRQELKDLRSAAARRLSGKQR